LLQLKLKSFLSAAVAIYAAVVEHAALLLVVLQCEKDLVWLAQAFSAAAISSADTGSMYYCSAAAQNFCGQH
jgi:hypothetical protein